MSSFDDLPQGRRAKSDTNRGPQGHLIALEPRMMFDGAAVATMAATLSQSDVSVTPHVAGNEAASGDGHASQPTVPSALAGGPIAETPRTIDRDLISRSGTDERAAYEHIGHDMVTGDWRENLQDRASGAYLVDDAAGARSTSIIFIDTAVENYADLVSEWSGKGEVVLIDASRDGIDQMMAALAGRSGLESIHIVSHGAANRFMLGTTNIDMDAVQGELAEALGAIGSKLTADGDILIYGCDVGVDDAGQSFIDAIAAKSGADVAASSDLTGAAASGGDWDLESRSGQIEAGVLISERYENLLQLTNPPGAWTIIGNSASNVIDGVTVTITFTGTNAFSAPTTDTLNNIAAFANSAQGTADVSTLFNNAAAAGITGTITITFSEAVTNPIINIDRLGGVAGTGLSNTATLTLATAGATLTKLAGPSHLTVGSTTISRQVGIATAGAESSLTNSTGSAAGSVQVNGTFTSLTFTVSGASGDGFEINTTINRSPDAQNDGFTINRGSTLTGNLFANNGNGVDADPSGDAITITRINGAVFTVGAPVTLSSGTLTITNAATGAFTFVPNTDSYGIQNFTYTISDASGGTDTATATIVVNDVPVLDLNSTPTLTNVVTNPGFTTDPFAVGGGWTRTNGNAGYTGDAVRWTVDAAGNSDMSQTVTGFAGPGGSSSGAAQIVTSIAWNNSSNLVNGLGPAATMDIMVGGVTYARITTGGTTGGLTGTVTYFNGASGPTTTIAGNQNSSTTGFSDVTINLPTGIANSAALTYRFNSNGGGTDFAIDNVRVNTLVDATSGRDWTASYTENGTPVSIADTDASITDGDSANMQSATIVLTNEQAGDRFRIGGVAGTVLANGSTGTINGLSYTVVDTGSTITIQLTGSATKAVYADTIESVFFESTSDNPGTTSRVINVTVNDGTTNSNTAVTTISIAPVNDAPVNTLPASYTMAEDSGVLALTGLSIADADANSGSMTVTLSIPVGSGTLNATGAGGVVVTGSGSNSIVLTGTLANINAYLAGASRPTYTQVADFNGSVTLTMTTNDGGNSGSGGALSDTDTRTITITAVADIAADTPSVNEDTALLISPLANDSFENAGAQITAVAGLAITPGGSVAVPNGSVTLNASNQLVFTPAAHFNGTSTFSYTVSSGGVTETANITVTVNAVNDAPAGTDAILAATEDTPYAFTAANFGFSDAIDGNAFAGVVITSVPANGTMLLNGVAVTAGTFVTAAQINGGQLTWQGAANANGSGLGSFTFQVRDNGGTAGGGQDTDQSPNIISFNVTAVNDAPAGTDAVLTAIEDTPYAFTAANFGFSDAVDGNAFAGVVIATLPANGTMRLNGAAVTAGTFVTAAQIAAGQLTWQGAANANGSGLGSFTFQVRDNGGTANGGVDTDQSPNLISFNVTAVNDAPAGTDVVLSATEDTPYAFTAANFGFSDAIDNNVFAGVVITTLPANGTMLLNGAAVSAGTFVTAAQIAAGQLTWQAAANANGSGLGSFTFQVRDNGGTANGGQDTDQSPNQISFTVAPVNDAPVLDLDGATAGNNYTANYVEDGAPVAIATATASVTDIDSANMQSATFVIANGSAGDILSIAGALPSGITANYNPATYTLTLSGTASSAAYATAIGQIRYATSSDTPATIARTINGTVTDASGLASAIATATVNVAVANDPIVNTSRSYVVAEDGALTLSGLSVSDPDAGSGAISVTLSVPAGAGTISASPGGNVSVTGSGTNSIVLSGTLAEINAYLANAATQPVFRQTVGDFNGTVQLTMVSNDNGNTGTGGASSDSDTTTITITAVADIVGDTASTNEDTAVTISPLANDSFENAAPQITAVAGQAIAPGGTVNVPNGTVLLNASNQLVFTPAANFNGTSTFSYTVTSGGVTETANVTVTVNAVNDMPTLTVPANVATNEDASVALTGITFGDIDAGSGAVRVTLSVPSGVLIWTTVAGIGVSGNGTGTVTLTGTISAINAAIAGSALTYTPAANANGTVTLTTTINDQGNSGIDPGTSGDAGSEEASATTLITIAPVNDAPVAVSDSFATTENAAVTFAVLGNDSDIDSPVLTITQINGTAIAVGGSVAVTGGSVRLNADATLTFTPTTGFSGTPSFTYTISDGALTSTATVFGAVGAINHAPGGTDATLTLVEDSTYVFTAGNFGFGDALDGNNFTGVVIATLPANGTMLLNGASVTAGTFVTAAQLAAGQLTFTPAANANGIGLGTFTFQVRDDGGTANGGVDTDQSPNMINFTVTPVNDAPGGTDAVLGATEDTPFVFTAGNFGFSDPADGNGFAGVTISTLPANGTLTLNGTAVAANSFITAAQIAAGQLVWTPAANANGSGLGSFTFQVRDDGGTANGGVDTDQSPNMISFNVAAVNDAPVAVDDSFIVAEDTPATIDVRANDSDIDAGAVLTVTAVNGAAITAGGPGVAVTGGTVTLDGAGRLVFTPAANYNGPTSFSYTVRDENGATATANVSGTVTPVADPVVNTVPASATGAEDTAILFSAANGQVVAVTDPDNGVLTVTLTGTRGLLSLSTVAGLTFTGGDGTSDATMTFSGSTAAINAALDGLRFQPDSDYNGPAQISITTSRAPDGASDTDIIALTITPVADIVADTVTTPEDTPVSFNVLTGSNGASPDNFEDAGRAVTAVTQPPAGQGSVTFAANGALVFTPAPDFNGTTSFTYTVTAGGVTETATVTVNVTPVNDAPVLDLDGTVGGAGYAATYTENGPGIAIIAADGVVADIDSPALTGATVVIANGSAGDILSIAGGLPPGITASYDAASFTLTLSGAASPAAYKAALDAVRYASTSDNPATSPRTIDVTVSDGALSSAPARATISIIPVNDAPAGTDAVLNATEDTPYVFAAGNFGFSDAAEGNGFAGVVIATLPVNGTLTLNGVAVTSNDFVTAAQIAAGQLVWTPAANANGSGLGSFTFQVRDDGGTANGGVDTDQSPNTISFTVANVNDPPVSSDLAETIAEDSVLTGTLPGYTDADGDIATYRAGTTAAAHGTVTINSDGSYSYTPAPDFNGTDIFSFIVDDGNGGTVEQYVTITVTPVNDAPVVTSPIPDRAQPDGASVSFDTSTYFADAADGDPLSFSVSGLPAGLTMGANGLISGTIDRAASQGGAGGVYTVTVTASDGKGGTVSDSFTFKVTNPAPVAVNDAVTTAEDTPVTLNLLDGTASGGTPDSDPDGDPLAIIAASAGNGAVMIGAGGAITYTPNANFNGTDTIVYTISDGNGGTAQAVVSVTVTPVNDAPATTPIPDRLRNDGDSVSFNAATFFNDVDVDILTYTATGLPPGLTIDQTTGVISGTIAPGASGPTGTTVYTITVTADDGKGGQSSITYRNTVVNIAPNANDDGATTNEDTPVDIAVLANDSDPDGDTNFIVRVNNQVLTVGGPAVDTANGSVQLVDVGGVTMLRFTPDADYNGTESFTYTIDDGNSGINTAIVTVTVNPVNDTPNASPTVPDRVRADGQSFTYDMGDFFSDPDGDALNYVITGLPFGLSYNPATGVISGTIDRNASQGGPAGDGIYAVTVTAYDRPGATGLSQTRSFALTTTNPGPTANNDTATVAEDGSVIFNPVTGAGTTSGAAGVDVDPDGDPLIITAAAAGHGAVTINADGTLSYVPDPDFNGTDTIIYTIDDGNGGTSSASVTVTVSAMNDAPVVTPIPAILTTDDAAIDFDVGSYFDDVDAGTDLTFSFTGPLPPGLSFDPATGKITGTLTNDASANTPYVMTITADDGNGGTVSTTLTWNIQNLPPHAFADTLRLFEDAGVTSGTNVLDNDVDPDNDGKVVSAINGDPARVGQPVTGSAGGTFVVNVDGSYTFDPGTAFDDLQVGESRTTVITYLLDDTDGGFDTGFITVTVDGTNDAPIAAVIPNYAGADGQSITANPINISGFFSDVEGDALTFTQAGLPPGLTMDSAGRISGTIDANASVSGPYTVVVTANDGRTTTQQSFRFDVSNPAPTAADDNASTVEDQAVDINVLGNDTDPDGDTLTIDPAFPPQAANGTVTVNANGTLHYVPDPDYNGVDTIIYRVTDGQGGFSTGVVNVSVGSVNDAPVGTPIPDTERNDGASVSLNVSGYFSDVDGDTLTYSVTGLPAGLSIDPGTGVISGTIASGASGPTGRADYNVQVTANDSSGSGGLSATGTFKLTAINIAPVANADNANTNEDTAVNIAVLANDTDADGDAVAVIRVNNVTLVPGVPVTVTDGTVTMVDVGGVMMLRFMPRPDFNGATTFSYSIGDGNGGFDDAVVSINVAAVNDTPVASSQVPDRSRPDGASVSFDISSYFSDVDGDDLDYIVSGLPPGLIYDPETGLISGTLASNASQGGVGGVYSVAIIARDPFGAEVTQSFDFTVTNPPPVAANDLVTVAEDGSVTFNPITGAGTVSGAAGADVDPDGDTLRVVTVAGGQPIAPGSPVTLSSGLLSMNADGTLTFAPVADFNGPVTITYTISDGNGGTSQAVVTINVTAVNDPPTIDLNGAGTGVDNAASFVEGDAPVLIVAADGAAFDVEDGIVSLDIALAGFVDAGQEIIHLNGRIDFVAGVASSGTISFGTTTFRYSYDGAGALHVENAAGPGTPMSRDAITALIRALQYENRSDDPTAGDRSLSFTVTDAQGATSAAAVATVAVSPVNDAPTSTPITNRAANDADPVTLDVSGNFADVDGTLVFTAAGLPPGLSIDPATGVISGTIDRSASVGGPYNVTVTATDDGGASTQQAFVWTVANPAPTAVNDALTVSQNAMGSGDVTPGTAGQDSDPDGDPLTVSAVNGATANVGAAVSGSAGGSFTIAADGSYSFDPGGAFDDLGAGQRRVTTATYTISDGQGGTSTATVTVTVTGANDAPVGGTLPARTATDGEAVRIDTAAAFSDRDNGDTLSFSATGLPPGLSIDPVTGEILGTLTSGASQIGPYSIVVTATDSGGLTASAGFTLAVANLPPVAIGDSASTAEDTVLAGSVATNDSDTGPDGDPLGYSVVSPPAHGTLTLLADGRYTYIPDPDFNGTDSFTYRVDDGNGGSAEAIVTLTVTPVNDGPVAANDNFVTDEDTPVTFDVRANDLDVDGPALTVTAVDGTAIAVNQSVAVIGGSVALNPDGTLTFTPNADYNGSPQFTYTVSDGMFSDTATVLGIVTPVNDGPQANAPPIVTNEDVPAVGQVASTDVDGDTLTYTLTEAPTHGTLTINPDGSYNYTPDPDFNGDDSFIVLVSDGNGRSVLVTIPVQVLPVNDVPVASAPPVATDEDTSVVGRVTASDVDGDALTYAVAAPPANGTVTVNADGSYTYTPNPDFNGTDSFTVLVSDGNGGSVPVTIPVVVRPVNDPPVASAQSPTTDKDTPVSGQIVASDVDGDRLTFAVTTPPANGTVTVNADGSYTYTPALGFVGSDSFTVLVSDGNGGTVSITIPVTILSVTDLDMNALLDAGDPFGRDVDRIDAVPPADPSDFGARLVILDAVNGVRSLNGTPGLDTNIPVLTAVNGIDPLNGTDALSDVRHPVNVVVRALDRFTIFRSDVDRLFDNRFDPSQVQGIEGFSARTVGGADRQLVVESIVRGNVIYLELRDEGADNTPPIVEYQLRTRDGKPLPDWIRFDARGLAIIERPADADQLRLVAIGIRADGSRVEIPVIVQGATGEIQIDAPVAGREIGAAGPLGSIMASAGASSSSETAQLLAAFGH